MCAGALVLHLYHDMTTNAMLPGSGTVITGQFPGRNHQHVSENYDRFPGSLRAAITHRKRQKVKLRLIGMKLDLRCHYPFKGFFIPNESECGWLEFAKYFPSKIRST